MYLNVRCSADWLFRVNRPDGRFIYGYLPALNRRWKAITICARSGRRSPWPGRRGSRARKNTPCAPTQAVLTLLGDTAARLPRRPGPPPALPHAAVNRLAAAGLLVLAINELPDPQDDLLEQSEQLCNYIRKHAARRRLALHDRQSADAKTAMTRRGSITIRARRLYGLMRSQQLPPGGVEDRGGRARPWRSTAPGGRRTRAWPSCRGRPRPAPRRSWQPRSRRSPTSSSR